MISRRITSRTEDYLKSIYLIQEAHGRVTSKELAREMGMRPPSVTSMLKKLAIAKLVNYSKYGTVSLTKAGKRIALETIRHHRLLETFFRNVLGYGLGEVHDEADELEHIISEKLEDRISRMLGNPECDPHGSPIPAKDGSLPSRVLVPLTEITSGCKAKIARLLHRVSEQLAFLEESGLLPQEEVTVVEKKPFRGPLLIKTEGRPGDYIGYDLASLILVHPEL